MSRYEVIESRRWVRDDGRTASPYGAAPWVPESERDRWAIQTVGFTVRDTQSGTVGIGRAPWPTREAAQAWAESRA